jgi:hypothetical protein
MLSGRRAARGERLNVLKDNILTAGILTDCRAIDIQGQDNIEGVIGVNVTFSTSPSRVSPGFVDKDANDLQLRTTGDGFSSDSLLLERSKFLSFVFDTVTIQHDLGAWAFNHQTSGLVFVDSINIPRPEEIEPELVPDSFINVTRFGRVIGKNRPTGLFEKQRFKWKNVTSAFIAEIRRMLAVESVTVSMAIFPEKGQLSTVTANGAHTAGDIVLTIDAQNIAAGAIVVIGSVEHLIIRRYPETGDATQLVFDRVIAANVADDEVLNVKSQIGFGEYNIDWQSIRYELDNTQDPDEMISNFSMNFIREL